MNHGIIISYTLMNVTSSTSFFSDIKYIGTFYFVLFMFN